MTSAERMLLLLVADAMLAYWPGSAKHHDRLRAAREALDAEAVAEHRRAASQGHAQGVEPVGRFHTAPATLNAVSGDPRGSSDNAA